jgi:hypothetical protein
MSPQQPAAYSAGHGQAQSAPQAAGMTHARTDTHSHELYASTGALVRPKWALSSERRGVCILDFTASTAAVAASYRCCVLCYGPEAFLGKALQRVAIQAAAGTGTSVSGSC